MSPGARKKSILSGMTPSHHGTLGNYIGALKNWVKLQSDYDCLFMVADQHAITARHNPKELRERTYLMAAGYIAGGIDPASSTLFIQSHVSEHSELAWVLACNAYMGELGRMTQYKDKSAKEGANIPVGLFSYPLLMASDILLYQADLVPVGEDQKQHIELTRDIALRINNLYGKDTFVVPEPFIPPVGARIMSLQDARAKMSKSDPDPNATVFLTDSDDAILKKIKRAVTDSGSEITLSDDKPGVKNLLTIQSALTGKSFPELVASYVGKQYGHLKVETAEIVVQTVKPIRERVTQLLSDRGELDRLLAKGADHARTRARPTLEKVYDRLGFVPRARI